MMMCNFNKTLKLILTVFFFFFIRVRPPIYQELATVSSAASSPLTLNWKLFNTEEEQEATGPTEPIRIKVKGHTQQLSAGKGLKPEGAGLPSR